MVRMCGRYAARRPPEEAADWFGADLPPGDTGSAAAASVGPGRSAGAAPEEALLSPQAGIAPTDSVLVVVGDEAGRRRLLPAQWGLVPSWARDRSIASSMFNARSETAADKPAFRDALQRRRCLVPADAFYEWSGPKGARRPWLIRPASTPFLAFGGLFEHWRDPAGGVLHSCTILTTAAAPDIEALHDRAPLLIDRDQWGRWLDPTGGADTILDLLRPAPAGSLELTPLAEPSTQARTEQPALFAM
jgi:putative SOS response-associated peptidase YedK